MLNEVEKYASVFMNAVLRVDVQTNLLTQEDGRLIIRLSATPSFNQQIPA